MYGNIANAPDAAYVNTGRDVSRSTATLDIDATAVPCAMIMVVMTVLRLPARTVGRRPLWRRISLTDRQKSGQPEYCAASGQSPRNAWSHLRQHGQFDIDSLVDALGRSAQQLERFGDPKDVADLLF